MCLLIPADSATKEGQEEATAALVTLAARHDGHRTEIALQLIALLESASTGIEHQASTARALSRFARASVANQAAAGRGAALLIRLMEPVGQTSTLVAQMELANALWALADNHPANCTAVVAAGGIPKLLMVLDGHPSVHRFAAGVLWSLCEDSPNNQRAVAKAIPKLVAILRQDESHANELSGRPATSNATTSTPQLRIHPPMNASLAAPNNGGAAEMAAGALSALCGLVANQKLIVEAGGIDALISILDRDSALATGKVPLPSRMVPLLLFLPPSSSHPPRSMLAGVQGIAHNYEQQPAVHTCYRIPASPASCLWPARHINRM